MNAVIDKKARKVKQITLKQGTTGLLPGYNSTRTVIVNGVVPGPGNERWRIELSVSTSHRLVYCLLFLCDKEHKLTSFPFENIVEIEEIVEL